MFDLDRLCMGCMGDNDGQDICPICGFDTKAPTPPHALALRTVLQQRYIVGKMLIYGGDGITYLAFDKVDEKVVRIKEYYPAAVCQRKDGVAVRVKKDSAFTYNSGIMDFLELSEKLQGISDSNGIYPVINIFEENGTAYRVTSYTPGINLRDYLLRQGGTLTWEQAKPLFMPLFATLNRLHKVGIIHRAISPETLVVGRDGKLRITDFSISSVRTAKGDLAPQLYAGYAAVEQYGVNKAEDGPHTDVYGLAATLFKALIGNPPAEATQRLENDNMSIPKRLVEEIPQGVLIALANALQILPKDRTETIEEFKQELIEDDDDDILPVVTVKEPKEKAPKEIKEKPKKETKISKNDKIMAIKAAGITAGALLLVILIILLIFWDFGKEETGGNHNIQSLVSVPTISNASVVSNSGPSEYLYEVPDFTGKTFADVSTNPEYIGKYTFKVAGKQYSNEVQKGFILSHTPVKNSQVAKDTVIEVIISLGPEKVHIPNIAGLGFKDAKLKLLEVGIDFDAIADPTNISNDDPSIPEGAVVKTVPAIGTKVSRDERIEIYIKASYSNNEDQTEQ